MTRIELTEIPNIAYQLVQTLESRKARFSKGWWWWEDEKERIGKLKSCDFKFFEFRRVPKHLVIVAVHRLPILSKLKSYSDVR